MLKKPGLVRTMQLQVMGFNSVRVKIYYSIIYPKCSYTQVTWNFLIFLDFSSKDTEIPSCLRPIGLNRNLRKGVTVIDP